MAALAIPVALVAIHFAAVRFTGASVNPARSIGPALIGGDLSKIWMYIVAPIVGGILGALIYRAVNVPARGPKRPDGTRSHVRLACREGALDVTA